MPAACFMGSCMRYWMGGLFGQNTFNRPSCMVSALQCGAFYAQFRAPFRDIHRLPFECQADVATSIVGLSLTSSPFAVIRLVVAIVVTTLKRLLSRTLAHVGKEVFKLLPSRADHDAASSIVSKLRAAWIRAARNHALPNDMGLRAAPSMSARAPSGLFCLQASARLSVAASKRAGKDAFRHSAIATTQPSRRHASVANHSTDSNELPETLAWLKSFCHLLLEKPTITNTVS